MITDNKYMICFHIGRVDTSQHVGEYVKEHQYSEVVDRDIKSTLCLQLKLQKPGVV